MSAMTRRRKLTLAILIAVALAGAAAAARPYLRAAAMIVHVIGAEGRARAAADFVNRRRFSEDTISLPTRHGPVRARVYQPDSATGRAVLAMPGVNPAGIDEPRLVTFARALARAGRPTITIELPDLTRYRITSRDVDRIEDAAVWLSGQRALTGGRPFGLTGVSFAAGLTVTAAGRASLKGQLAFVASFGGHGDLRRVVRFLCTGELPDGTRARPHDYGLAVILLNVLDRLVPPGQIEPLREAVLTFMDASWLDLTDDEAARRAFARARALQAALREPSATIMRWVNDRDVETAGPRLLPHALVIASDPALSPERSPATGAPVYLLHGDGDNVIPTQESERLAAWLAPRTRVRLLVTPLLIHVEAGQQWQMRDAWALLRFWTAALQE
jgi:dienelactone hydrolase